MAHGLGRGGQTTPRLLGEIEKKPPSWLARTQLQRHSGGTGGVEGIRLTGPLRLTSHRRPLGRAGGGLADVEVLGFGVSPCRVAMLVGALLLVEAPCDLTPQLCDMTVIHHPVPGDRSPAPRTGGMRNLAGIYNHAKIIAAWSDPVSVEANRCNAPLVALPISLGPLRIAMTTIVSPGTTVRLEVQAQLVFRCRCILKGRSRLPLRGGTRNSGRPKARRQHNTMTEHTPTAPRHLALYATRWCVMWLGNLSKLSEQAQARRIVDGAAVSFAEATTSPLCCQSSLCARRALPSRD